MKTIKKAVFILLWVLVLEGYFGVVYHCLYEANQQNYVKDWENLRSVTAEAYININEDPYFVNTATQDQPMEISEEYYTCVESAMGHGRIYAVVYADGSVEAYFGTPEKTLDYYWNFDEWIPEKLHFPFIFSALLHYREYPQLVPHLCGVAALNVGVAVLYIVRRVKKKNFEATIAALQADTEVDESP